MYIKNIVLPYVDSNHDDHDKAAVIIMDNFKGQIISKVADLLEQSNIHTYLLPPNTTDRLQPLDLAVIKPAKEILRQKFKEWYAQQVAEQIKLHGCHVAIEPVNLGLPALKELGAVWLEKMYEYICDNPQFIVKSFLQSGIPQALNSTLDIASEIHADPHDDNIDNNETEDSEDLDTCDEGDDSLINQSAYLAQYYAPELQKMSLNC